MPSIQCYRIGKVSKQVLCHAFESQRGLNHWFPDYIDLVIINAFVNFHQNFQCGSRVMAKL